MITLVVPRAQFLALRRLYAVHTPAHGSPYIILGPNVHAIPDTR